MLLLNSLKISLPVLLLAGFLGSASARAEMSQPQAYESLIAVPLAPGHAPRTVNGVASLSAEETLHHEKLPMQLDGPIKKIMKTKYKPSGLSRDNLTDF